MAFTASVISVVFSDFYGSGNNCLLLKKGVHLKMFSKFNVSCADAVLHQLMELKIIFHFAIDIDKY